MKCRIISGRSSGKTKQLMLMAKERGCLIACSNPNAMKQKAHSYGISGLVFVSYDELFKIDNEKVMIDEVEQFLQKYLPNLEILGYSLTNED